MEVAASAQLPVGVVNLTQLRAVQHVVAKFVGNCERFAAAIAWLFIVNDVPSWPLAMRPKHAFKPGKFAPNHFFDGVFVVLRGFQRELRHVDWKAILPERHAQHRGQTVGFLIGRFRSIHCH